MLQISVSNFLSCLAVVFILGNRRLLRIDRRKTGDSPQQRLTQEQDGQRHSARDAGRLGVSDRIQFLESNLLEVFPESQVTGHESPFFDLIISNPPYVSLRDAESLPIEVRDHEPHAALFGGEEGYELYAALISQAARHLKPGGLLVLELGYNSLPAVQPLLETKEWANVGVTKDLARTPRVIAAERLSPPS